MDIRKHRTLFLLGGIFIVLVLIYLALSSYQWDAGEADSGEDSQIQVTDLGGFPPSSSRTSPPAQA